MSSRSQSIPTAAAIAAATVSTVAAATLLYTKMKQRKSIKVLPSSTRKAGRTSHIHIQTANAVISSQFFKAFGLVQVSSSSSNKYDDRFIILACPGDCKHNKHQPYIVLEEVSVSQKDDNHNDPSKKCASDLGVGRLCLGVKDAYQTVQQLREDFTMHPVAPPVCDRPGSPDENGVNREPQVVIVAYRDAASGTMLELVSLNMTLPLKLVVNVVQSVTTLEFPLFVHANVNTSQYATGLAAYQALGYSTISKHYGKVVNTLYQALDIPAPGIANQVTLIKTPDEELFCIDLIEWQRDLSSKKKNPPSGLATRLALAMNDLPNELDWILLGDKSTTNGTSKNDFQKSYWKLVEPTKLMDFPKPLGKALLASVEDPDGLQVTLVEYPMEIATLTLPENVHEKVILITGCDSGFGRSLACRMTLLGFSVVAACYSQDGANYLKNAVATTVVADLGTRDGVQNVINACKAVLRNNNKQLRAVVNNAGMCIPGNVEWLLPIHYEKSMQVNFHAPVTIIHELLSELKECPGSRILQVSSVCGMLAQPTNSTYCATKHALEAFSDSLRCEMLPFDTHVCIVQPATMKTPLGLTYWDEWFKGYQNAPLERKQSFQADKTEQFVNGNRAALHNAAENPDVTIQAMVKALLEPKPPTRLRTGAAAELFFRPASFLPDSTRDKLLWNLLGFDSVVAPVMSR